MSEKPKILMIDDEQQNLQVCGEFLTARGYEATPCSDSTKAIPLLKAGAYQAVLLDIRMPGIEGTDLLPLIKRIRPELPVIIISAYCDSTNMSYYLGLGAFETLAKPVSPEILVDTVARAVNQQERIPFVLTSLSMRDSRDQLYRKLILYALRKTNWNQVRAAQVLGVSRYCLIRWIKKLSISY